MRSSSPTPPSLAAVNALFLICFVLVLTLGSVFQAWSPGWGIVLTEILLVFLPALLFLRRSGLALRPATGANWPGWEISVWSTLAGLGLSPFALWLSNTASGLMGYTLGLPPDFFPRTWADGLLMIFALAIVAPLCEEFFFRGVIQRRYLRIGPTGAILWTAALFLIFHLSLQRSLVLIPVAFALGYATWQSDSLVSGILLHMGYNLPSGILMVIASLYPGFSLEVSAAPFTAAVGLLIALVSLWALRMRSRPEVLAPPRSNPVSPSRFAAQFIPVVLAIPIFGIVAGAEVVLGRYPQLIAQENIRFKSPAWGEYEFWRYELHNAADESVGDAECSLRLDGLNYALNCVVRQDAFELEIPGSYYKTDAYLGRMHVEWPALDLQPAIYAQSRSGAQLEHLVELAQFPGGRQLIVEQGGALEAIELPEDALLPDEWAWRFSSLEFGLGNVYNTSLTHPSRWDEVSSTSRPQVVDATVVVSSGEPIAVPAGDFLAWKVIVEQATAWYDVESPHTLLRYDDGFISWRLTESQ